MKRLLTYTTFFITRNPFQRLVSAHKSKFEDPGGSLRKVLGIPIAFQQAEEYLPDGMTYIKTRYKFYAFLIAKAGYYFFLCQQLRILTLLTSAQNCDSFLD